MVEGAELMNKKIETSGAAFLFLLGLVFTIEAYLIPKPILQQDLNTTPAFFPVLAGSTFTGLALIHLVKCWTSREKKESVFEGIHFRKQIPGLLIMIVLLAYIILMEIFGWLLCSVLMLGAVLTISEIVTKKRKKVWTNLLLALVLSIAVFIIFNYLLGVPLPQGIWGLEVLWGL
jgi:phosphatidylserine synthase